MNEVAATILKQLSPQGAGGLRLMLGTGPFLTTSNSVTFRFKGSRTLNHAEIALNGRDTYDLTLSQIDRTGKVTNVNKQTDLYDEDLRPAFESQTGLITAVPRIISAKV